MKARMRRLGWRIAVAVASVGALVAVPAVTASADTPLYQVSGSVVDSSNNPITYLNAHLYADDPNTSVADAFVDHDGSFTFNGIPDGTYKLEVDGGRFYADGWYGNVSDYADASPIQVVDGNVAGLTITLPLRTYTVAGTVTGGTPPVPLANQPVNLFDGSDTDTPYATTTTDANGNYSFAGLPDIDAAAVQFPQANGWADQWWQNAFTEANATFFELDDSTGPYDVVLSRIGTLSGRVTTYGSSVGLGGADVQLQTPAGDYIDDVTADSQGRYTFAGIPAGQYKVSAFGPDWADLQQGSAWDQEWYGEQSRLGWATVVTVPPDGAVSNINFSLHRDSKIEGVITDAATKTRMDVATVDLTTTAGALVQEVGTDSNGKYEFDNLAPEYYKVHVVTNERDFGDYGSDVEDWYGGMDLSAAHQIHITAEHSVVGANIALNRGGLLGGAVAGFPFEPAPDEIVELKTLSGTVVQSRPVIDWQWGFVADPGTYEVEFIGHDGYYGSGYFNTGGYLGSASHLTVHTGSNLTYRTIDLPTLNTGKITGKVLTSDGSPPPTTVTASRYPDPYVGDVVPQPAVVNPDGTFTFDNVAAGQYTLTYGSGDVGPAYYHDSYGEGQAVTVTAGRTTTLSTQTVTPDVTVHGTITDPGQTSQNAAAEFFTLRGVYVGVGGADPDGDYSVQLPKGRYRVRFLNPNDSSKGGTWLGGGQSFWDSDVLDTSVSTEADGTLAPASTITGVALDAVTHLPVDDLVTTLFQVNPDGSWQQANYTSSGTDGTGEYTFTGVATGTYVVQFWDQNYTTYHVGYDGKSETLDGAQTFSVSSTGETVQAPTAYLSRGYSTATVFGSPARGIAHPPTTSHGSVSSIAR